jgi:pyruvate formate lyase activating enzyme
VRINRDGTLYTLGYGNPVAVHIDSIEKKPFFNVLPGENAFSIAVAGCNMRCIFCQNWQISQDVSSYDGAPQEKYFPPRDIADAAVNNNCASVSYTYTEPTIFMEYALDTCKAAREKGLKNIFVTNGYMSPSALEAAAPWLDAANVDIKFFKDASYLEHCGAKLEPVLESVRLMKKLGIWVEITTLLIPGVNDSVPELKGLAGFISSLDRKIPWHISRFHPDYKFNACKSTPEPEIRKAVEIGRQAGLFYVYAGNVSGGWGGDTHCHKCQTLLVKREIFSILNYGLKDGKCPFCGEKIPGVFDGGR